MTVFCKLQQALHFRCIESNIGLLPENPRLGLYQGVANKDIIELRSKFTFLQVVTNIRHPGNTPFNLGSQAGITTTDDRSGYLDDRRHLSQLCLHDNNRCRHAGHCKQACNGT